MADDKRDDAEWLEPDLESDPPPRAQRSGRRRDDDDYDDDREEDTRRRGRKVHYDEDGEEITSEHSMWAIFTYVGVLVIGFLAPLIILIIYLHKSPFVVRHAKESLNHLISLTLLAFLVMVVMVVIGFGVYGVSQEPIAGVITGYVLLLFSIIAINIYNLVVIIMATIAAANYRNYRFPFTLRLIG